MTLNVKLKMMVGLNAKQKRDGGFECQSENTTLNAKHFKLKVDDDPEC